MVNSRIFGVYQEKEINVYTLTNQNGLRVEVLNLGGIIRAVYTPDRHGKLGSICLGYETLQDYLTDNVYLGALIGRYANRIAKGRLEIEEKLYSLPINNGPNHLHGGPYGFHRKIWNVSLTDHPQSPSITLRYTSPDMEEGYPGELTVAVTYTLDANNQLVIDYKATTTKTTVLNLTQHAYFNLNPTAPKILDQHLQLFSHEITENNDVQIPTGKFLKIQGTAYDFGVPKPIGSDIKDVDGYDNNYLIDGYDGRSLCRAAIAYDPEWGRKMEMYTTEPGVQLYTSNYFDGSRIGMDGRIFEKFGAFCLEAQHFPDSPNHHHFPSTILNPGETYTQKTVYAFSAQ